MEQLENENTQNLRLEMVADQLIRRGIHDSQILAAFQEIPRHLFVPSVTASAAYSDQPLPTKSGQTISQPYVVALMLSYLGIRPEHNVLEIGSGSGYSTAILSKMCRDVHAIEVYQELIDDSLLVLNELQITNVHLTHRSGWEQISEGVVYDRIILWASPPRIPEHVFDHLKEGGVLVAPEGKSEQFIWICIKKDGSIIKDRKDPVRFVPMVQGSVHEIDRRM